MENILLYTKKIEDEAQHKYMLEYTLLTSLEEQKKIYGISVKKTDAMGNKEIEEVSGFSEDRNETERFLEKLAEGYAFPMELAVLCDEYISERENPQKQIQEAS